MNSPSVFSETSSASFSRCSVKARRAPQVETFHSSAMAGTASDVAAAASAARAMTVMMSSLGAL